MEERRAISFTEHLTGSRVHTQIMDVNNFLKGLFLMSIETFTVYANFLMF